MADADEDSLLGPGASLRRPSSPTTPDDQPDSPIDADDEEPLDFRLLPTGNRNSQSTIPKRGEKDFEPLTLQSQRSQLDASRLALHNALSTTRVHTAGKGHNIGLYVTEREQQRDERLRHRFAGEMDDERVVVMTRFAGVHNRTIGRSDARGWTWLRPEEALFMLERGSLDVRWGSPEEAPDIEQIAINESEAEVNKEKDLAMPELPMSLQGAYASFIGKAGLTLERYLVYATLKRSGYVVMRAGSWEDDQQMNGSAHTAATQLTHPPPTQSTISALTPTPNPSPSSSSNLIYRLISYITNPRLGTPCPSHGPLLAPGLYRSYNNIFRSLALVPYHNSRATNTSTTPLTSSQIPTTTPKPPFTISFHIHKASPTFAKSHPSPPSYHICIIDARTTTVPTMTQIGDLLDTMPDHDVREGMRTEGKIKLGRRSVLMAVVDQGVIGWLRFSESEVGRYRLYEEKGRRGGKGKGRGGFRGRGRGRGK